MRGVVFRQEDDHCNKLAHMLDPTVEVCNSHNIADRWPGPLGILSTVIQEPRQLLTRVACTHHRLETTAMSNGGFRTWVCLTSEQGTTVHLERRDKGKGDRLPRAANWKSWSILAVVTEHKLGQLINSKNFMLMVLEAGSPRLGHRNSRVGAPSWFIDGELPTIFTGKKGLGALRSLIRAITSFLRAPPL